MTEGWTPWSQQEREEEEPRTLTELYDVDWQETSFVTAPDNRPARVVMWKDEPQLTDEEIEEIIEEVATEKRRAGGVTTALQRADALAMEKIEEEPERFAKIADPRARLAAARSEVWAENPSLGPRDSALAAQEPAAVHEPVMKGAKPYAELHRIAKAELPDLYRSNPSAAVSEISKSRPDLRDAYTRAVRS
jgi:hypothetical protein